MKAKVKETIEERDIRICAAYTEMEKTLTEIGEQENLSRERIRQILVKRKIKRRNVGASKLTPGGYETKVKTCSTCDKEIWRYSPSGKCRSCSQQERYEDETSYPRHITFPIPKEELNDLNKFRKGRSRIPLYQYAIRKLISEIKNDSQKTLKKVYG